MLKGNICFYILVAGLIAPSTYAHAEAEYYFRYTTPKSASVDENKESNSTKEDLDIVLNLRNYTVGESVNNLAATLTGFKGSPTWSLTGRLPEGMNFGSDGQFSGSPREIGSFTFSLSASSEVENLATKSFSFQVDGSLMFEEQHWVGNVFRQTVAEGVMYQSGASDGTAPYTYQVISGSIPPDYQFRTTQDMFEIYTNIPAPIGYYPFKVRVRDANGITTSADFSIKLEEQGYLEADFPPGYVGVPYTGSFSIAGSTSSSNTITASGDIPGLSWSEGVLSGIPTTPVTNAIVSAVANIDGHTITEDKSITINESVQITEVSGKAISQSGEVDFGNTEIAHYGVSGYEPSPAIAPATAPIAFTAKGGSGANIRYEIIDRGNLPDDFTLSHNGIGNRVLTIDTDRILNRSYTFTVRAYDQNTSPPTAASEDIKTITVNVYTTIRPTQSTEEVLHWMRPGQIFNKYLVATQGKPPYRYKVIHGSLPSGLTLNEETGLISGNVNETHEYSAELTLQFTDAIGSIATYKISAAMHPRW